MKVATDNYKDPYSKTLVEFQEDYAKLDQHMRILLEKLVQDIVHHFTNSTAESGDLIDSIINANDEAMFKVMVSEISSRNLSKQNISVLVHGLVDKPLFLFDLFKQSRRISLQANLQIQII